MTINKSGLLLCLVALMVSCGGEGEQPWCETSLKDIRPEGWLEEKLVLQKNGLTGHPEALSYPYNTWIQHINI